MCVSQTHVGCPDPEARLFVYYLWEDYKRQKDLPKAIFNRLTEAGRAFGKDVSLFAPISGTQHEIRREIRSQGYNFFWREIGQSTPGLLLTVNRLGVFDPAKDEYVFFPLPTRIVDNESAIETVFKSLHEACVARLNQKGQEVKKFQAKADNGLLSTVYESAQLKLTFLGLGVDFKPILSRYLRPRR